MITEAGLRGVQVFDIDQHMAKKWDDLNELQRLLRRNNINNTQASTELEKEYKALQAQLESWRRELKIKDSSIREYRTVILIEEISKP
jgi:hypothetical protein